MDDDEEFTIPVPPPGFPPGPPGPRGPHDVIYFREGAPPAATKEHEDIMLRRVPRDTAMRFRGSAGGRGMTHAQYLTALVDLHRKARELADAGNEQLQRELTELGLASVTV
jgi:hypothetical protein